MLSSSDPLERPGAVADGAGAPAAIDVTDVLPADPVAVPLERGESAAAVDRLLDDSWDERGEPYDRRQRLAGAALSLAFLIAALMLSLLGPGDEATAPVPVMVLLVVGFAVASRVEFPIGAGYAVPTQLFLVPLFVLGAADDVPLFVFGALAMASVADVALRRVRVDRMVDVGVDSWHALAPALLVVAMGAPDPDHAPAWLFPAAFLCQILGETATSTLRVWLGQGIAPRLQLKVLLPIWGIDFLLTPIALVAATASTPFGRHVAAPALIAIVLLLALLTRDRTARINQAHERLQALRDERSRLEVAVQRIGDAFASRLDLDALLNITMRAGVEALDADAARASANPGAGRRLVRRATMRESPELEPALHAAEQAAAMTGKPSVVSVDDAFAIACPVMEPEGMVAAGVIAMARRAGGFAQSKIDLLRYLCEQAGVAAADIERHTLLSRQALTDELTGLANHRRLQEVLTQGVEAHRVSGTPLALILFDLDNFKRVNDTRGHQTGDHVLRSVSDVLRSCCRHGDEAARYGGEELAIIVHATEFDSVLRIAERARAAVEALELVDIEGRNFSVTTSIGVAELGDGVVDSAGLIAAADACLYAAKHGGKNRVVSGASAQGAGTR